MVSISGSPAATSEPKASSMIARVTGQEITSERSIALLLAALKSDHIPGAPVRCTCTPLVPRARSGPFRSSAARTIAFESRAAPACTIAVCPSGEIEAPGCGGTTTRTAWSARSFRSTAATVVSKLGSPTVAVGEWTTTIRP